MIPDRSRTSSAPSVAVLLGSSDSPVPVVQKIRAARIASRSSSSAPQVHVRGLGLAIEEQRESVGGIELAEDDRGPQVGIGSHIGVVDSETLEGGP